MAGKTKRNSKQPKILITKISTMKKNSKGVVSVKLDDTQKTELLLQAESEGLTLSEFLRKKLHEEKEEAKKEAPSNDTAVPLKTVVQDLPISLSSLLAIDEIIKENLNAVPHVAPERDFLRKIAGQTTENPDTLSFEEETFLKTLSESIKTEALEDLLQEHNSVPIAPLFINELQRRTFKEMLQKRNEIVNEKTPSFNQVFINAIANAFADDCRTLYNRNLFKATYGFNYDEFKAVFEL
jgi:arsenate reductase-like glutaredoxin family protein